MLFSIVYEFWHRASPSTSYALLRNPLPPFPPLITSFPPHRPFPAILCIFHSASGLPHKTTLTPTTGAAIDANAPLADDLEPQGAVDSDEERDAIMAAIAKSRPRPLATRTFISTKSKYQFIRMKDMLHNALGGARGAGLFSTAGPGDGGGGGSGGGAGRGMLGLGVATGGEGFVATGAGPGPGTGSGFATPISAGLDGPMPQLQQSQAQSQQPGQQQQSQQQQPGSRRQSLLAGQAAAAAAGGGGPRQILPGQLPPPSGGQRKASVASVASVGGS
jgi:SAGA-associated factor 73